MYEMISSYLAIAIKLAIFINDLLQKYANMYVYICVYMYVPGTKMVLINDLILIIIQPSTKNNKNCGQK